MQFEDKVLNCKECGRDFVLTAGEQEFYAEKGFTNLPQRCMECRRARKNLRSQNNRQERELYDAVCSACGCETKVPFRPRGDRPVYCQDCFRSQRQNVGF